ncbi:hypothetical protein [Methylobacterium sp. SI9]
MSLLARLLLIAVLAGLAVHTVRTTAPAGPAAMTLQNQLRSAPEAGHA